MVYGEGGKLKEVRPGTNGFICVPSVMNLPIPDPMCMDAAVKQWLDDVGSGAPKPSNTVPGIAYMAKGVLIGRSTAKFSTPSIGSAPRTRDEAFKGSFIPFPLYLAG
ncbi:MAG: hypothetical protein ABI980_12990 [Nitrospirota bacterium]